MRTCKAKGDEAGDKLTWRRRRRRRAAPRFSSAPRDVVAAALCWLPPTRPGSPTQRAPPRRVRVAHTHTATAPPLSVYASTRSPLLASPTPDATSGVHASSPQRGLLVAFFCSRSRARAPNPAPLALSPRPQTCAPGRARPLPGCASNRAPRSRHSERLCARATVPNVAPPSRTALVDQIDRARARPKPNIAAPAAMAPPLGDTAALAPDTAMGHGSANGNGKPVVAAATTPAPTASPSGASTTSSSGRPTPRRPRAASPRGWA